MSAEILRRAADKIRETAQAATPGPWVIDGRFINSSSKEAVCDVFDGDGTAQMEKEAAHIAMWSPDVAELVALVLEGTAGGLERRGVTARHTFAEQSALALARRILGEDA